LPAWIPFKVRSRATADGHLDLSQSPTVAEQDFAANQPAFSDEAKLTAQWPALRSRLADATSQWDRPIVRPATIIPLRPHILNQKSRNAFADLPLFKLAA